MVMDKLERQIKKHKEKLQGKKTQQGKASQISVLPPTSKKNKPRLIYEKNYFVRPMSIEEAIMQMDLVPENFIIFQNTESKQLNMLYKRQNGDLALVEPQI
jgi:putative sigma-54 modulation protein